MTARIYHIRPMTLALLAMLLFATDCLGGSLFEQGNAAFRDKQYEQALNYYHRSVRTEGKGPAVYYNLGNAYFRLKAYPEAIVYFEKSLKLDPENEQAHFNLELARNKALTKIERKDVFFVRQFAADAIRAYSARTWSVFFLIVFWSGVILLLIAFRRAPGSQARLRLAGIIMLFFAAALFGIARYRHAEQTSFTRAVVVTRGARLMSMPVEASATRDTVEAGNAVLLLDRDADWYKVELPNGKQGWMHARQIVLI